MKGISFWPKLKKNDLRSKPCEVTRCKWHLNCLSFECSLWCLPLVSTQCSSHKQLLKSCHIKEWLHTKITGQCSFKALISLFSLTLRYVWQNTLNTTSWMYLPLTYCLTYLFEFWCLPAASDIFGTFVAPKTIQESSTMSSTMLAKCWGADGKTDPNPNSPTSGMTTIILLLSVQAVTAEATEVLKNVH